MSEKYLHSLAYKFKRHLLVDDLLASVHWVGKQAIGSGHGGQGEDGQSAETEFQHHGDRDLFYFELRFCFWKKLLANCDEKGGPKGFPIPDESDRIGKSKGRIILF